MLDNKAIGQRIKAERESKKMTQEDIATELGLNKSTIQRYEAGVVEKIKMPILEAIAKILGVNPAWIIGTTNNKEPIKIESTNHDPDIRRIQRARKKMSQADKEKMMRVLETMFDECFRDDFKDDDDDD